jgi:hypothetical protein
MTAAYIIYVLRWIVLAVPGAWLLRWMQRRCGSQLLAMVLSQGLLGLAVYRYEVYTSGYV